MSDELKEEKNSQEVSEKIENKEESKPEVKNKVNKITKRLACKFTEQEHREATDELLDLLEDKDRLEQDKSDLVKSYGNQIKGIEEKINEKAALVRSGYKEKPVECEWRFNDPRHGRKSLWRLDENKIIESEDMDLLDTGKVEDVPIEKPAKPGDNGKVFVFKDGREAPIFDYADVKDEKIVPVNKVALSVKSVLGYNDLPEEAFRLIRGKAVDGKTVTYYIDLLPVSTESPAPEASAPVEEKKGKGRNKKEDAAPVTEQAKTETPAAGKKPEAPKSKPLPAAKEEVIAAFLAKHNLSMKEVEDYLRSIAVLIPNKQLQESQQAIDYTKANIEKIKSALKKTA